MANIEQHLSLFIPRVHYSQKKDDVRTVFESLDLGVIKRIDIVVPGMKHDPHMELEETIETLPDPLPLFNMAFVHYTSWNTDNENAMRLYKQVIENDEEVRIVYDDQQHYYKVYKNKTPKSDEQYELEQAFMEQQRIIKALRAELEVYKAKETEWFRYYDSHVVQ